jgi:hypothetical protein
MYLQKIQEAFLDEIKFEKYFSWRFNLLLDFGADRCT